MAEASGVDASGRGVELADLLLHAAARDRRAQASPAVHRCDMKRSPRLPRIVLDSSMGADKAESTPLA
jgi:hypothetical protein